MKPGLDSTFSQRTSHTTYPANISGSPTLPLKFWGLQGYSRAMSQGNLESEAVGQQAVRGDSCNPIARGKHAGVWALGWAEQGMRGGGERQGGLTGQKEKGREQEDLSAPGGCQGQPLSPVCTGDLPPTSNHHCHLVLRDLSKRCVPDQVPLSLSPHHLPPCRKQSPGISRRPAELLVLERALPAA